MRLALIALLMTSAPAIADPSDIVGAEARQSSDGRWNVSVTLRHPDTGWDHYADGWEVLSPDGTRLGYRELLHPHVHEQPFTRSLSGVTIPEGTTEVFVEARTNTHGWGEARFPVSLK